MATAKKGIVSVRKYAEGAEQFEASGNTKGKDEFVLKAKNHRIIGTGADCSRKGGMTHGIMSVAKNGPKA